MIPAHRNKRKRRTATPRLVYFILFIFIASVTVIVLEYLDFRKGNYSFLFHRLLRRQTSPVKEAAMLTTELAATLKNQHVSFNFFKDKSLVHFKISCDSDESLQVLTALTRLATKYGGSLELHEIQHTSDMDIYLYRFARQGRTTHAFLLEKKLPEKPKLPPPTSSAIAVPAKSERLLPLPKIAIIIDDIGYHALVASQLHELKIPLTAAVIPDAPYAAEEAARVHEYGLEALIHLPMQSRNAQNNHGDDLISLSSTRQEMEELIRKDRAIVPDAKGINNHMGSLITASPELMQRLLEVLKSEHLFFIDSKTTADTMGYSMAKSMGIKTAIRDIFLDDIASYSHTLSQIRRLVDTARLNGKALAIGHPLPSTLSALKDALPWLQQQRVQFVFASRLLESP